MTGKGKIKKNVASPKLKKALKHVEKHPPLLDPDILKKLDEIRGKRGVPRLVLPPSELRALRKQVEKDLKDSRKRR